MRARRPIDKTKAAWRVAALLHAGERMQSCADGELAVFEGGRRGTRPCLLFATDRRLSVLFTDSAGADALVHFPFEALTALTCARGVRRAQLSFTSPEAEAVVRGVRRPAAGALLAVVERALRGEAGVAALRVRPFASARPEVQATLERLGQLRDRGDVSVETFGGMRSRLLADAGPDQPGVVPGADWGDEVRRSA